jgi:hypothetical protein
MIVMDKIKLGNRPFIDKNNALSILDSSNLLKTKYRLDRYNISLVDSLSNFLVPLVADSIASQAEQRKYEILWKYYLQYDQYLSIRYFDKDLTFILA